MPLRTVEDAGLGRTVEDACLGRTVEDACPYKEKLNFLMRTCLSPSFLFFRKRKIRPKADFLNGLIISLWE